MTGRPPYPGLDDQPVVQAVARVLTSPPVTLAGVPDRAAELVNACLSVDPAARPSTAAEVARRVDEVGARWPQ
jgi:serine/threonine-protein kinase